MEHRDGSGCAGDQRQRRAPPAPRSAAAGSGRDVAGSLRTRSRPPHPRDHRRRADEGPRRGRGAPPLTPPVKGGSGGVDSGSMQNPAARASFWARLGPRLVDPTVLTLPVVIPVFWAASRLSLIAATPIWLLCALLAGSFL